MTAATAAPQATPTTDLSPFVRSLSVPPEPGPLAQQQREALQQFTERGLPTRRDESWRFTNLARLGSTEFATASFPAAPSLDPAELPDAIEESHRVVVVDGHVVTAHSDLTDLPDGLTISSLADLSKQRPQSIPTQLGQVRQHNASPFVALNVARATDGVVVRIHRNTVVERPIHIISITTQPRQPTASFPRTLVVAEEQSQATVIETLVGGGEHALTIPVTEIHAHTSAVIEHVVDQQLDAGCRQIAALHLHLDRAATIHSASTSFGGALARREITAVLTGEGADCRLDGLYVADSGQHMDTQVVVEHRSPHCTSEQLFKGVLDGTARTVFNGRIFVAEGAQKTDARQSNRNLLLSRTAQAQSNPQLEIFADDVRCTHGSTTGQLDSDAIFYLRSRGIDRKTAEGILTVAFADEVVSRFSNSQIRANLRSALAGRLPHAAAALATEEASQ